jgi:ABC-type nitrate/sulfonate/bicarbonate transport system permease component
MAEGERWRSAAAPTAARPGSLSLSGLAWNRATVGVVSILLGLLLWEFVARQFMTQRFLFAPPSLVFETLVEMFLGVKQPAGNPIYWHIYVSLSEFFIGFVLGALVGVTVGVLVAIFRPVDWALDPWIAALYATPTVALAPLFIMWFGVDMGSKVAVVFLVASIPILINTQMGIQTADPRLLEAVRSFGASRLQQTRIVLLPSAVAAVIAGMRMAVGRGLVAVVVGELFGARAGLGFLVYESNNRFDTASLFAVVMILAVLGVAFVRLLDWLQAVLMPWRQT